MESTEELAEIEKQLNDLMSMTDKAQQCLSTLSISLATQTFDLESQSILITPVLQTLLEDMNFSSLTLTVGPFLTALNGYLVSKKLVDQNDYEVILTDILRDAFNFEVGIVKVPFVTLLSHIPVMNK
jgi:DNA-binding protein YbaB